MIVKSFPRGGKKSDAKKSNTFSSKTLKSKKTKLKLKPKNESVKKNESILFNVAQNLKYSTLRPGMNILGRIFKITDYYAIVSLPGQISGKLQAADLSESYTTLLKNISENDNIPDEFNTMSAMYKQGDYVVCYVKEINSETKRVTLSTEPKLINQNLNPSFLTKNTKIAMTVSSVEDHGYVLETGLNNLRAFLSLNNIQDTRTKFCTGKQVLCAIKDIKTVENIFTINLSLKSKRLNFVESNVSSLDNLIPGSLISLTVDKVLKDGLRVYFGNNNVGYINQVYIPNALSSFEKGQQLNGTLLYIVPGIKFAYFCLPSQEEENKSIAIGDIAKAKVLAYDSRGIIVQIRKENRGFIPLKRTGVDFEKIKSIFKVDSIHKCKVIAYDSIAKLYICSKEKKVIEEQRIDLSAGKIVEVTIVKIDKENGYITASIGKIFGTIPPTEIADTGSKNHLKVGDCVKARVLDSSDKIIFTLKKSLIESQLPILCKFEDAKVNGVHHGSVMKIGSEGILVRFFNNFKGWIPKRFLNSQNPLQKWNPVMGETIMVVIKSINIEKNNIIVAPSKSDKNMKISFEIGDVLEGVVTDSSIEGVHLRIKNSNDTNIMAFLPAGHMSPCIELGKLLAAKTMAGDTLSVIVFSIKPDLIVSWTFAPEKTYPNINSLDTGDTMLCSVKKIHKESIKVLLPIKNFAKYGTVPLTGAENIGTMYNHQILAAKVTKVVCETKEIFLTTQLSKIWKDVKNPEADMLTSVELLSSYLNKLLCLSKNISYSNKSFAKINIGQKLKGTVENVMDHGLVLKLEGNIKGMVQKDNLSEKYTVGDKVEGSVLWINYLYEHIELSLNSTVMQSISMKHNKKANIPIGVQLRGEIVLVTDWFVLVVLKGQAKGILAALPARRHLNDMVPDLSPYKIGNKIRCYGVLNKEDSNIILPICMLKSAFESHNSVEKTLESEIPSTKRKIQLTDDDGKSRNLKKLKTTNDNDKTQHENIERNCAIECSKNSVKSNNKNVSDAKINLKKQQKKDGNSGLKSNKIDASAMQKETADLLNLSISDHGFNWDNFNNKKKLEDSSSDDENEIEDPNERKKKKKNPTETREIERLKEREIREQEEALSSCQLPQTVDQFDKLVLSNPDSSLAWVHYMTHHLQATDVEKARAVAKRALKTINFREENERLNVWQAWLNLESKFGSAESLHEVFQEAMKANNPEKICTHMLNLHLNAKQPVEVEKIVNIMIAKFKQNPDIWINCGATLLKMGLKDKSRHIMQRALQSLPEKEHIDVIVRFAVLESKFGDKERSQTLFEQILGKYKKRTDVWSSYVDSLIKTGDIDLARKVLDRATAELLPVKKMKVLWKKYIKLEEEHGTLDNVARIRKLAATYAEEQRNKVKHS